MKTYEELVKEAIKAAYEKAEEEKKAAEQAAEKETKQFAKFEVGATYATRSICNSECIFKITIVKRTEKTVTIDKGNGKTQRCKIHNEARDAEYIFPYGVYSMCPVIDATDKIA